MQNTNNIQSVFKIDGQGYTLSGYGQETVSIILQKFRNKKVIFLGFMIDSVFVKGLL